MRWIPSTESGKAASTAWRPSSKSAPASFYGTNGHSVKIVLFTKFLETLPPRELGEYMRGVGYDGLDLAVRHGYPINPRNVGAALPEAVRLWATMGLSCELITTETDLTDSSSADAAAIYEAAAEAGVPLVKTGFFNYYAGDDYWRKVADARRALEGFVRLGQRTGVKTVYQNHSGNCLGSNCAGLMHLMQGFDPAWMGAHVDGGHMALDGEDVEMGLAMCEGYLTVIGAKDGRHVPDRRPDAPAPYGPAFVFLGQGATHWRRLLKAAKRSGFDGPISVGTEYTEDQEVLFTVGGKDMSAEAASRREVGLVEDLRFLRREWARA